MRTFHWNSLSKDERCAVLERPAQRDAARITEEARAIVEAVRRGGDAALRELTRRLDRADLDSLEVSPQEIADAERALSDKQHAAIESSIVSVRKFHTAELPTPLRIETTPGVVCERIHVPVRAVGLYVPAGLAPLPSTAIMLAVPAAIAGCPVRILCTAPSRAGVADAAVLVAAQKAGIKRIFKLGGAQAIAAMAYGTESVPKCDKLFGPGNAWVAAAKMLVACDPAGAAADLPAGPTEVMVIADEQANAGFIAADLLAQAEHGPDAQALLVTSSAPLAELVECAVLQQLPQLSRQRILDASVAEIRLLVVPCLDVALDIANEYAPEHLLLQVREPRHWLARVRSAGAVFLGPWSPESTGDYCSGPNHTLPTYGYAKAHSGLSVVDFQKRITVQELSPSGLRGLGDTTRILAGLEGLDAHAAAVDIRLAALAAPAHESAA
jgi:histidinol dehydrogenase